MLTAKSNTSYPMRSVKVRPIDSLSDPELYGPSFKRGNIPASRLLTPKGDQKVMNLKRRENLDKIRDNLGKNRENLGKNRENLGKNRGNWKSDESWETIEVLETSIEDFNNPSVMKVNGRNRSRVGEKTSSRHLGKGCNFSKISKLTLDGIIYIFCFAGLLLYVHESTVQYLEYSTISNTVIAAPKEIDVPSLSVCFNYPSLIDRDRLYNSKDLDEATKVNLSASWPNWTLRSLESHLTAKNIFDLTPAHDQILVNAMIRGINSPTLLMLNESARLKEYIEVRKYLRMGFVCYHFQLIKLEVGGTSAAQKHEGLEGKKKRAHKRKFCEDDDQGNDGQFEGLGGRLKMGKNTGKNDENNVNFGENYGNSDENYRNFHKSEKLRKVSPNVTKMQTSEVKNAFTSPGMIYELTLNEYYFARAHYFTAEIFHGNEFPKELSIPIHGSRSLGTDQIVENMFYLSYFMKISKLLQAPYEPSCVDYQYLDQKRHAAANQTLRYHLASRDTCFDHCYINALMRNLSTLPYEAIISRKFDLKFQSFENVNETNEIFIEKIQIFMNLELICEKLCEKNNCTETMYVTDLLTSEYEDRLIFRVYIPSAHSITVEAHPEVLIVEYLNVLFSYFSIFFGFSFLGFSRKIGEFLVKHFLRE